MNGLRKQQRRKDAVFRCQWSVVSYQRSGAALPSDCFDCAPDDGNYLHSPRSPKARALHPMDKDQSMGIPDLRHPAAMIVVSLLTPKPARSEERRVGKECR